MQQININELKPHPRNNEFFDDITGDKWEELLESIRKRIKENKRGNIEPIVITQDKVIVSGHQRVRAFKELGIPTIESEIKIYDSDDEVLLDLLESNIRRRGEVGGSAKKVGMRIKELERLYGIKGGNNQYSLPNNSVSTQSNLAIQMEMSVDTLQNYKMLADMIPELDDLVQTGIVMPTTALAMIKQLSESEQLKLISSLDTTKKITQKQVQQYIDKIKDLESKPPKIIDNTDYDKISALEEKISVLETQKRQLETKIKLNQEDADKFKKLKSEIEFLTKKKSDLSRQINSATELAGLTVSLQKVLENDLAPIKFKRCMEQLDSSDVAVKNLTEILEQIDKWSIEMKTILGIKYEDIIDMQ